MIQEATELVAVRGEVRRILQRKVTDSAAAGSPPGRHTLQKRLLSALTLSLLLLCAVTTGARAESTQSITLHPGWNAVYLEVQPALRTPGIVFQNLPVESVWTWYDRGTSVEFIRNPSEGLWAQPGWSVYAKSPDKAAANNLFAVFANRAYLIKLGGGQNVTWTVTGTAATDRTVWTPNSFNLTGFHVNPVNSPTLDAYLSPSPSHKGQQVYRLTPQGAWELIASPTTTPIASGTAYWVYCNGTSSYQGPVNVQILGSALDYGASSVMSSLTLSNVSPAARTVTLKFQPAADWFTYQNFNAGTGFYEYLRLDSKTVQLPVGRQSNIWLAVRRELLTTGFYQGTLEVTDDAGSRFRIPVSASK